MDLTSVFAQFQLKHLQQHKGDTRNHWQVVPLHSNGTPESPMLLAWLWYGYGMARQPDEVVTFVILGNGKGDSCQISPIKNLNSLLKESPINFLRRSCKVSTRLWVLCLALGEPSLQLATCHSQTNPPSMNKWFLHCGIQHRRATMFPSRTVHRWGAFGGGSYETSDVRVAFAWIHIDLVTLVSLWKHCHLPNAQFRTTHFFVRLAANSARRSLPYH